MRRLLIILVFLPIACYGGVTAATIWQIRASATAGNLNGCGWDSTLGGTDYSRQDAAQRSWKASGGTYTNDLAATNASPSVLTSASYNFVTADQGNIIHITAGTNFTAGWYQIVSTAGNAATLDRNATTGSDATGGTGYEGGACSLGSTLDDDLFENAVAGNIFYVKNSALSLGEAVSITAAGTVTSPIKIIGYNATEGDNPTGATRPVIAGAAYAFLTAASWEFYYVSMTGTASYVVTLGANGKLVGSKVVNTSTTANRSAVVGAANNLVQQCELISYRGRAFNTAVGVTMRASYLHDSDVGFYSTTTTSVSMLSGNLIAGNVTNAIQFTALTTGATEIFNNTLYGAANKLGTGINLYAGSNNIRIGNNIITGFVTGATHGTAGQTVVFDDWNDYYNNTTDVTNVTKGAGDSTADPTFTSVAQVTVTTATTSGSTLTKVGATFQTAGVTAGRDYVYITAGAGATAGVYGIVSVDSETQLTLDIAPGDSAGDVSAQITTGRNFAIGTNLKALGFPGAFPGGLTTGYMDIGAVQRQEPAASGGTKAATWVQ